jgi:hypothetical protein
MSVRYAESGICGVRGISHVEKPKMHDEQDRSRILALSITSPPVVALAEPEDGEIPQATPPADLCSGMDSASAAWTVMGPTWGRWYPVASPPEA